MKIARLLQNINISEENGQLEVSGLSFDSRKTRPGDLYFALAGQMADGRDYIRQALVNGAVAAVVERPADSEGLQITVPDSHLALALAAAEFYGHPERKLKIVGITGTNGKTTITYLLEAIFRKAGARTAVIGSTGLRIDGEFAGEAALTTPDPLTLYQILARLVEEGIEYVFMEASSHALAQKRVAGINWTVAVFTNISHDHLDYHKTLDNYIATKATLFQSLAPEAWAILNADDDVYETIRGACATEKIKTYGFSRQVDYCAGKPAMQLLGTEFLLFSQGRFNEITVPLTGMYNIYNTLAAVAVSEALGLNIIQIGDGLADLAQIPGRFEVYYLPGEFAAVIDYAHSPDSLKKLLETVRYLSTGRLITVFGCTGDRDRSKRPIMGRIASELSDLVIVTSDDPHNEDPVRIIGEITAGMAGDNHLVEPSRPRAVALALEKAAPGDMIVLAGKGHEKVQIVGEEKIPLSDQALLEEYLAGFALKE